MITTPDEVKGLMQERLYVHLPPLAHTKLSDWVREFQGRLGVAGYQADARPKASTA